MKTKEWAILIIIVIVVAVISSLLTAKLTGNVTGNAIFSRGVKANSCDADNTCEAKDVTTKSLEINGEPFQNAMKVEGNVLIDDGSLEASAVSTKTLEVLGTAYTLAAKIQGDLFVDDGTGNFEVGIKSSGLAGTGNAYACVDSTGKLYRKTSPCV